MKSVDFKKRLRRIPWVTYLFFLAIILWVFIIGFFLGLYIEAVNPPEPTEPVEAPPVVVQSEPVATALRMTVEAPDPAPAYTSADLETLALIIYQEAGGDACSDETRRMVGTVVLNRVASPNFPDTIQDVALQRAQYGRLYWTGLEWPERAALPQEAHAVARAYETAEQLLNGDRALPADVVFQAEFTQGSEIVAEADGFYFCR